MQQTITKIRALTVNVEIVEMSQTDKTGGILYYVAAMYVQAHGSVEKKLVRKSRLPGAATELRNAIQKDGLQTFRNLAT